MPNPRFSIFQLSDAMQGRIYGQAPAGAVVEHLITDSRNVAFAPASLFFALPGPRRDGHSFLPDAYRGGVRYFAVSIVPDLNEYPDACFIKVSDTLAALQALAAWRRRLFHSPVIGITGSNGKTIVKEWLFQLLHHERHIVRSPRSYNSQIGVPLSVWQLQPGHDLALFEAGVSRSGEMARIAPVIGCTMGIFTALGDAHSEGFPSVEAKLREKSELFQSAQIIFYGADDSRVDAAVQALGKPVFRWGASAEAELRLTRTAPSADQRSTVLEAVYQGRLMGIEIPFSDRASIHNALLCWCVLLHFKIPDQSIRERMARLEAVEMRLEIREGINECTLINDSYNSDLNALAIALDVMAKQAAGRRRTLILSDILESGRDAEKLYTSVADLLCEKGVQRVFAIGAQIQALQGKLPPSVETNFFPDSADFLRRCDVDSFSKEIILIKGARRFGFERIADRLARKVHQTSLEINLSALAHNLRQFQQLLAPGVRTMAMVKAAAYGSGSVETAKLLELQQVDYLAVAYADEGVELRRSGIRLPILVLNPEEAVFDMMTRYRLEPELYSLRILRSFARFSAGMEGPVAVHLKIETGMNRLGFAEEDLQEAVAVMQAHPQLRAASVFSHLAASEDPAHDDFTERQAARFESAYERLAQGLGHRPMRHLLNSAGIARFPQYHFDMVRLGIGLYGFDASPRLLLQPVLSLRAAVSQIKTLGPDDTVGYGRRGTGAPGTRIATISIGYADGLLRAAGNGKFSVLIRGQRAPLIGNVCMDMCMADVSNIPDAREGDPVTVFGSGLPLEELARALGAIPYEVLTGISPRVKRVYVQE
ncbi:MAG: bifunctional UDP-N-acetylmuramoyl-tripeptide:D-alanyl-D-alanine ligase/alanine racemase [Saprospiraceae bacterium]|nr:bifunctional UDP-N-acetylmuramoyl-tripeptide:D-alanyl-D-alanine ligase/alanine racemase [Saprospiraceae bacterium]